MATVGGTGPGKPPPEPPTPVYWVRITNDDFRLGSEALWGGIRLKPMGSSVPSRDGEHWYVLVKDENENTPAEFAGKIVELTVTNRDCPGIKTIVKREIVPEI
jgi:hypothetical protein